MMQNPCEKKSYITGVQLDALQISELECHGRKQIECQGYLRVGVCCNNGEKNAATYRGP
ncbi:Uncharacterised protein [Lederbergia lenta]|uniref:Uncharacterized protein n=1 Tax=Lederbergia lenta TaxID=1467 RepID=A0A2X4WH31_LEDLE|nr:Uncharacterised protein [Lederbergia lenta]